MPPTARKATAQRPGAEQDQANEVSLDGAASVFADDLLAGENLLWQSRAGAGAYARAHLRAVFMGLTFFIISIVWHTVVTRGSMMVQLDLATWLFAGVGVLYVLLPLAAYMKAKWFLFYALTNQRLIILQVFPKHKAVAFPIKGLNRVAASNGYTGNGTLLIDAPGAVSKNPTTPRAGFYGVKYVAKVVEAVETLQDPEAALKRAQAQTAQKLKLTQPAAEARFTPSSRPGASNGSHTVH